MDEELYIYAMGILLKLSFLMQHTSMSPDRKLITVVGDDRDGLLVDARNGKVLEFCSFSLR